MKKFTLRSYYSGFCTRTVQAEDECAAWKLVRAMDFDTNATNEILSNLDPWHDADEVTEEEEI
jgi:hypothetical protein